MEYIPKTKVLFNVQCQTDSKHIFEKVFELEENRERPEKETEVEAFCPYCSKIAAVTVKEKAPLNQEILRRFEEQDRELGLK
jgi:ribosomal protein L44E